MIYALSDIFGMMILVILRLGIRMKKDRNSVQSKRFIYLTYAVFFFLGLSVISELLELYAQSFTIGLYASNFFAFIAIDVVIISFSRYLSALLGKTDKKKTLFIKLAIMSSVVRMITTFILLVSGNLFVIENGQYVECELTFVPYIISGIVMLELLAAAIVNRKRFSRTQFVVVVLYLLIPVPPIIIEMVSNIYSLTGMSQVLSIILIYVLIQASAIEDAEYRQAALKEISETDSLTGLNNRRAFYNKMSTLKPNQNVGIIFCDLNGLKKTNDTMGHSAGDNLIISFADILSKSFGNEEIYRVSGDEFMVAIIDVEKTLFFKNVEFFKAVIRDNNSIASVGGAYGTVAELESIVSNAESDMYDDKQMYHMFNKVK